MNSPLPIAVTMGDPAGIGGEIILKAWKTLHNQPNFTFFCIDNIERLKAVKNRLNFNIDIREVLAPSDAVQTFSTALPVLNIDLPNAPILGQLDTKNGPSVIQSIEKAVELARDGQASAVVTNPIHKAALYETGFNYPGHTEFLAALGGEDSPSVMMLACPQLRVVPVTIHQSLKTAVEDIDQEKILYTARVTHKALQEQFGISEPRLAISGLNPHAGENGKMGLEDDEIIAPAIAKLQSEGINAVGPLPADTMFHAEARLKYDVAICMYHDQALIPIKTLDFHGGVNVTLGLPFIRTSPDHGTALDIAGKGIAEPNSLINALKFAADMAASRIKERV